MDQFVVTGMTCAACQAHVEKAVKAVPGVKEVSGSLLTNSMSVEGEACASDIVKAVEDAGYMYLCGQDERHAREEFERIYKRDPEMIPAMEMLSTGGEQGLLGNKE